MATKYYNKYFGGGSKKESKQNEENEENKGIVEDPSNAPQNEGGPQYDHAAHQKLIGEHEQLEKKHRRFRHAGICTTLALPFDKFGRGVHRFFHCEWAEGGNHEHKISFFGYHRRPIQPQGGYK